MNLHAVQDRLGEHDEWRVWVQEPPDEYAPDQRHITFHGWRLVRHEVPHDVPPGDPKFMTVVTVYMTTDGEFVTTVEVEDRHCPDPCFPGCLIGKRHANWWNARAWLRTECPAIAEEGYGEADMGEQAIEIAESEWELTS